MNKEEIDYWLRLFSNNNQGFMSKDGKKITLFKVFQELKELHYLLKIQNDYINELEKENKILRENAEHNDKIVDKVNWENLELKKQLEEYKRLGFEHLNDKCNKLENQQKEFIDYMNKTIEELQCDDVGDEELKGYLIQEIDIFKEILLKYKEIIEKCEKGE